MIQCYKHVLVVHDLVALLADEESNFDFVADDNEIVLVDNKIHFDF